MLIIAIVGAAIGASPQIRKRMAKSRPVADELGKLAGLKASGALTEAEYEAQKRRLLDP